MSDIGGADRQETIVITLKEQEFNKLVLFVKANYGLSLEKKYHLIAEKLCRLMENRGFSNFDRYYEYIVKTRAKEELSELLNLLTTNHTFFMREEEHFRFFEQTVLPQMYQKVEDKDLRIWSAGCSSGEEPYTLAMIMQDYFREEKSGWDKRLLATDVSTDILKKAIDGVYEKEAIDLLKPSWRYSFFDAMGKEAYQVKPEIKKEIFFRIFNLMDDFPFRKKFHVIFCRNVMIYFDTPTRERLIRKFCDMTEDGGYLFIGMSETIGRSFGQYRYIMPSVYKKG